MPGEANWKIPTTVPRTHAAEGTTANRPPATIQNAGLFYFCTDTAVLYQSWGGAWVQITGSGGGGGDMLANFVNTANALTNPSSAALAANTWNVITLSGGSVGSGNLPAPVAGHVIGIQIANSSTNVFTLNPHGSENIGPGTNSSRIMWAGETAILTSDGTNWNKVAGVTIPMQFQMYMNSTVSMSSGSTYYELTSFTTVYDNTGLMAGGGVFYARIQRAGNYTAQGQFFFQTASAQGVGGYLIKNGTTVGAGTLELDAQISLNQYGYTVIPFARTITFAAQDYLVMNANCTAGGVNVYGAASRPDLTGITVTEIPVW